MRIGAICRLASTACTVLSGVGLHHAPGIPFKSSLAAGKVSDSNETWFPVCAHIAGGVVLGADSRTSSGSYVANRVQDKITPLAGVYAQVQCVVLAVKAF